MDRVNYKRLARRIIKIYLSYIVFSVGLLLPLLNSGMAKIYQQLTGRPLAYELVGFNPFTLSIFAYGVKDINSDGTVLWSVDQLVLNPSPLHGLARQAIAMDEIIIQGLILQPEQYADGLFNFSDILTHIDSHTQIDPPAKTADLEPFSLPRVWVGDFKLYATRLQYTEQRSAGPFRSGLQNFHFNLQDFSTIDDDGDGYHLRAQGSHGGILEWQGQLSANQSKTWGRFALTNFALLPAWQFMEPQLNFVLNSGKLSLQGDYEFNWKKDFSWRISNALATLDNLDLTQTIQSTQSGESPSQVKLTQLALGLTEADSQQKAIRLNTVNLTGFSLSSGHKNSHPLIADMFALNFPSETSSLQNNAQEAKTAADRETLNEENQTPENSATWRLLVGKTQVENAKISWKVPELNDRRFSFYPININLTNFNNGDDPAYFDVVITVDQQAKIGLIGEFNIQAQSAEVKSTLSQLPLDWSNPVLSNFVNAKVQQGLLGVDAQLSIADATLTQAIASASINNFDLLDLDGESIASLETLFLSQLTLTPIENQLAIDRIEVAKLNTHIAINADGSTNLNKLFKAPSTEQISDQKSPTGSSEQKTFSWLLNDIELVEADIQFTDETPLSTFSTQIQSFSGHIKNIQSDKRQALTIDMKGHVDGYAPVTLKGNAKPFLDDPAMDLALDFKSIDLGLFNPYSTTFTGWKIEKGLLNVNLHYQLEDKRIVGKNRIILDQLTLGERIDSRRLVDIPLRLALALLTDENGIADIQVPVSGTTDDPDFSIGAIVWSAVRNSIMKIVTAPFGWLANLVGSQEELGQVEFDLLSSKITADASTRLMELKSALEQRPKLRLGISGDVDASAEGLAYKQKQLEKALRKQGLSAEDISAQNKKWREALVKLLADSTQSNTESSTTELTNAKLLDLVIALQPLPAAKLQKLSEKRAASVKQFLLVNLAFDPDRVFVKSPTLKCEREDKCLQARAQFSIKP